MKNLRKTAALLATLISATLLIGLTGCDGLEFLIEYKDAVYDISGKVINVREVEDATGYSIPAGGKVEVTKFGESTVLGSSTISSTGTYSVKDLPSGEYVVKVKNAVLNSVTWVGVPVSVEVAGGDVADKGVFAYTGTDLEDKALIILTWDFEENNTPDLDSHSYLGGGVNGPSTIHAYYPAIPINYRTQSSGRIKATLERDVTGTPMKNGTWYPVETTIVEQSGNSGTDDASYLRFYAHAFDGSISGVDNPEVIQPANAVVYVMYNGAHFGTFWPSLNTNSTWELFLKIRADSNGELTIAPSSWDGGDGVTTSVDGRSLSAMEGTGIPVELGQ